MNSRATTTVTIYRGTNIDDWGDVEDNATVVRTGVPMSIIEQKNYSKGEITTQPRNMKFARARCTYGTDVQINDRIRDERTSQIWTIVNISSVQNPVRAQDKRIDLQYVGMTF